MQIAISALIVSLLNGCAVQSPPSVSIKYAGSSTLAIFLRDVESRTATRFEIDTRGESDGGERALIEGRVDLAGVARLPDSETLAAGVNSTFVGRDAIAVVINSENPVKGLTLEELRAVFTGRVDNWRALGGPDLPVRPFVVDPGSATSRVFREAVLGDEDYSGCTEIKPDREIVKAVQETPGGIGQISFAFLDAPTSTSDKSPLISSGLRALVVSGEKPSMTNFGYPIARPLYLLWRPGNSSVEEFVGWVQSEAGQRVVMNHFVGAQVVGHVGPKHANLQGTGTLVVYTKTYEVQDGDLDYWPYSTYTILTRHGKLVKRVANHRSETDENPMWVKLPAGIYLIKPRSDHTQFLVTIKANKTTTVDVAKLLADKCK